MVVADEHEPYLSLWSVVDAACGLVFLVEIAVGVGAAEDKRPRLGGLQTSRDGFLLSPGLMRGSSGGVAAGPLGGVSAYLENRWNYVDLAVVVGAALSPVFREADSRSGEAGCTLARSLRPLRLIRQVGNLRQQVLLLYSSLMRLGTLILFASFSMTAYAVVGMQLLKGLYHYCDDPALDEDESYAAAVGAFPPGAPRDGRRLGPGSPVYLTRPCSGPFVDARTGLALEARGEWRNPTFHFDDFFSSFLSVFVLTTEGWAELVWGGLSATEVGRSPAPYANQENLLVVWYFFFGVAFFGMYMVNLFIGVVFDQYNEMKAITPDGKLQKKEARQWGEYAARLAQVRPAVNGARKAPQALWRVRIGRLVNHPRFASAIFFVIALNAAALAVTHRGQPAGLTHALEWANVGFAGVFTLEASLKVCGRGGDKYLESSSDVFDLVVTLVSVLDSLLFVTDTCADGDSAFLRFVRSMRVFRLMRLVSVIPGCRDILLSCNYAAPKLANIAGLLLILVFFFANVGCTLFRDLEHHGSRYANFKAVSSAMQLLFIILTGDAWTDYYEEMVEERPDMTWLIVAFFLTYLVITYFVIVNLFVMVLCEAFEVLSESNRRVVEKTLPEFVKAWGKLDPEGTGLINASRIEELIRLIPEPIGVGYPTNRAEPRHRNFRRLRTKAEFLRRSGDVVGGQGGGEVARFQGALKALVRLWLNEVGHIKSHEAEAAHQLISACVLVTQMAKRWLFLRSLRGKVRGLKSLQPATRLCPALDRAQKGTTAKPGGACGAAGDSPIVTLLSSLMLPRSADRRADRRFDSKKKSLGAPRLTPGRALGRIAPMAGAAPIEPLSFEAKFEPPALPVSRGGAPSELFSQPAWRNRKIAPLPALGPPGGGGSSGLIMPLSGRSLRPLSPLPPLQSSANAGGSVGISGGPQSGQPALEGQLNGGPSRGAFLAPRSARSPGSTGSTVRLP
mmetsp:Transcript_3663/g.8606  ORF Transcript_3663/g.8606 Transcript_3663/m.8606 type:complete len:961 (+) Transcript_3663:816-3698(+)